MSLFIGDVTHRLGLTVLHVALQLRCLLRTQLFPSDGTDQGVVKTEFGLGNGETLPEAHEAG